jgi:hypothetical protein
MNRLNHSVSMRCAVPRMPFLSLIIAALFLATFPSLALQAAPFAEESLGQPADQISAATAETAEIIELPPMSADGSGDGTDATTGVLENQGATESKVAAADALAPANGLRRDVPAGKTMEEVWGNRYFLDDLQKMGMPSLLGSTQKDYYEAIDQAVDGFPGKMLQDWPFSPRRRVVARRRAAPTFWAWWRSPSRAVWGFS